MEGELRVTQHEGERLEKRSLLQQRSHSEKTGEQIDSEHHLHRGHLVFEKVVLPVGCEAVENDVPGQNDHSAESRDGGRVLVGRAREQKHANAQRDQQSSQIFPVLIAFFGYDFAHKHDGDDFGCFGQDLGGEAYELERFVLAPAAHDVGEGGEGVFVHGGAVPRLFEEDAPEPGHGEGQDPVHEDQKLGVLEALALLLCRLGAVRAGHDALLQHAPCQV